jgi:hypothetical protein
MDADAAKPLPAFGFLTVLESAEHGMFGGYLVLSPQGRPLEFRCSTPIAPSRAQQILYGPTLRPYLLAEVIGQSLVRGAELPVTLILTDHCDMLPLGLLRPEAVVHVQPRDESAPVTEAPSFEMAGCRVTLADGATARGDEVQSQLEPLAAHVDLCEPFGRIRAALTEAQLASQDAADLTHDNAAAA